MALQEDPGFLRLFFQAIFDIVIKPIQGAWKSREKTIHGYLASILAIGIFLYFFISGLYNSINYFYGIFYEDQFNNNLQQYTTDAMNKIFSEPNKYTKEYIFSTKTGSFSSSDLSFFPIGTPKKAENTGAYKMLFLATNPNEMDFSFLTVTVKNDSFFSRKIFDISLIKTIDISESGRITPAFNYSGCDIKFLHDFNKGTGSVQQKCNLRSSKNYY